MISLVITASTAVADPVLALNTPRITRVEPADNGICPREQMITISKCRRGTMISCNNGLSEETFACDAEGFPFRVTALPQAAPAARQPYTAPQQYSYRQRTRRTRERHSGFFNFLSSIFKPQARHHAR